MPGRCQAGARVEDEPWHDIADGGRDVGDRCATTCYASCEQRERALHTVTDGRIVPERLVKISDRHLERPLLHTREPPVAERIGIGRVDVNRAVAELAESMQTTAERAGLTLNTEFVFGPQSRDELGAVRLRAAPRRISIVDVGEEFQKRRVETTLRHQVELREVVERSLSESARHPEISIWLPSAATAD